MAEAAMAIAAPPADSAAGAEGAGEEGGGRSKRWLPLESNPEVLTRFAAAVGLDAARHSFHDVFGLDDELLAMVPQPVLAVLLLFPLTDEDDGAADKEADAAAGPPPPPPPGGLYYMKQTIGNACGTIAMLHAVGNNLPRLGIEPGSFLARFFDATAAMAPAERGRYLERPPRDAPDLEDSHRAAGETGATAAPPLEQDVDLHFVAFVEHGGQLYELDGRRAGPVAHGPTSPATLLRDVAAVTRRLVARTSSLNFNLIALAATPADDDE